MPSWTSARLGCQPVRKMLGLRGLRGFPLCKRFDRCSGETLGIALAFCREVNEPFGNRECRAVFAVHKAKLVEHRVICDV